MRDCTGHPPLPAGADRPIAGVAISRKTENVVPNRWPDSIPFLPPHSTRSRWKGRTFEPPSGLFQPPIRLQYTLSIESIAVFFARFKQRCQNLFPIPPVMLEGGACQILSEEAFPFQDAQQEPKVLHPNNRLVLIIQCNSLASIEIRYGLWVPSVRIAL